MNYNIVPYDETFIKDIPVKAKVINIKTGKGYIIEDIDNCDKNIKKVYIDLIFCLSNGKEMCVRSDGFIVKLEV
jgi:hypothetical protein